MIKQLSVTHNCGGGGGGEGGSNKHEREGRCGEAGETDIDVCEDRRFTIQTGEKRERKEAVQRMSEGHGTKR